MEIDFNKKLNIVYGTNGLGKTTLLTMIQYAIIGPYCGAQKSRNYGGEQKKRRPVYDKGFFRNRMRKLNEQAYVRLRYTINDDQYDVKHSLYKHSLISASCNGKKIDGVEINYETYETKFFSKKKENLESYLIYNYHQLLMRSTGLPDENSLIVMMNEIMFFTEDREYIFWNEDTGKLLIAKYFMDSDRYLEYERAQQLVKMYDSQARLKTYEMSFIKKFLGDEVIRKKEDVDREEYLQELTEIAKDTDKCKESLRRQNDQLNELDKKRIENRIQYEYCVKELSDLDRKWYVNIFPDEYQEKYIRYESAIRHRKCPFCGSEGVVSPKNIEQCFFCGEKLKVKEKIDLKELDIQIRNKEKERDIVQYNYENLQKEIAGTKRQVRDDESELNKLLNRENQLKRQLDQNDDENYKKYQKLELEKNDLLGKLEEAKSVEIKMRKEIDESVEKVFQEYYGIFKKYANSFFGENQLVTLKLVGDKENRLFKIKLNGSERETYYDMSESQRIFLDLSFRLSILDYFHTSSYFICETPDSTLDLLFEDNAVRTFSNYINAGNSLILSANARNSTLILKLMKKYKDSLSIINLLEKSTVGYENTEKIADLEIAEFL
ncbi:MAG: AAA family ATPase [Candidatus Gastranaerophilales bacterium]|nr:AAA family ATPase [Candidatus Gastranaerophilales bacterium]